MFAGKVVTKKPDSGWVTFVDYFNGWVENNNALGPANSKPLLVCKQEPSALTIKKTLTKIKNMHPKDRNILGDKLIRDNLKELTVAFFKPATPEGQSIEAANLRKVLGEAESLIKTVRGVGYTLSKLPDGEVGLDQIMGLMK